MPTHQRHTLCGSLKYYLCPDCDTFSTSQTKKGWKAYDRLSKGFRVGWAFFIAIYCESNILHRLETSENIAIPEDITIFLRYFFMHDISHFWPFMDQLTNAIHQFSCVFTCVSLIGSSLLLYLICHIFVMNWHHTLHFKSATFFANKYKVGHFCRKTQNTAFLSQKIST